MMNLYYSINIDLLNNINIFSILKIEKIFNFIIMVLFIKGNDDENINEISYIISKQIINKENNLNIFNIDGSLNGNPIKNNVYIHNEIEYEITNNIGTILLYLNNQIDSIQLQELINNKLIILESELNLDNSENYFPYNTHSYNSTNYTLIESKLKNERFGYRKFIFQEYEIKNNIKKFKFIWYIKIIYNNENMNNAYLKIAEYNEYLDKKYLFKSVNTIILDYINLFNVKSGHKQIDYPYINQYKDFNKTVFDHKIYITNKYDIDYEFANLYMKNISISINFENDKFLYEKYENINNYDILIPNPSKKWYDYLNNNSIEKYNNKKHLQLCFISNMPLYDSIYLLKISHCDKNKDKNKDKNEKYILVSSFIFHTQYNISNDDKLNFYEYFRKMSNYEIIDSKIVKWNITKYDALLNVSNLVINPNKKKILLAIIKYGIYNYQKNYGYGYMSKNNKFITMDLDNKCVYIGVYSLTDKDIILAKKTNCIIYNIIT